jgi:hypothetical protein
MKLRHLVITTALAICLAIPADAHAAAPRSFYGLIPATDPDPIEIARMGTGKVGTLRINFVWGTVQPSESGTYDWSHYDAIIGAAARQGIRVLPTVYSSPSWVAKRTNYPPTGRFRGPFQAFVQAAAQRYGSNGSFWSSNPTIPKTPVIDWQLWNEMNSPSFWFRKPSPKQYVSLLKVFSRGIKALAHGDRLGHRRQPHTADRLPAATGRLPATELQRARGQPGTTEDRGRYLVLVARPAGWHLVQPHGAVHAGPRPEARLERVRRPDRRLAGLRRY